MSAVLSCAGESQLEQRSLPGGLLAEQTWQVHA